MYPKALAEAKAIFSAEKKSMRNIKRVKMVICPPHIFIYPLIASLGKGIKGLSVGAQNAFCEDEGARTGETSPKALALLGATHVIVGHSERRALGETNTLVAQKITRVAANKLTAVLCVGERARDDGGAYFKEVSDQLRHSLGGFPRAEAKRLVIAYEPIWAIGAKALRPATPSDFHEMSILIRRHLVEQFGKVAGFKIPILYGGSVDERNALGFLKEGGADGLLVGRVSLSPEQFSAIIRVAESIK